MCGLRLCQEDAYLRDGSGQKLKGTFTVQNNRPGITYLLDIVAGLCRKHGIRPEHVFFGGEDGGAYSFNFIHALVSRGFLVLGINANQAKKERESYLKHILMSGAVSISQYGHPEMRQAYQTDMAMGRDARTRLAQNLLRISLYLIETQQFFLPPSLHRNGSRDQIRKYYAKTWTKVLIKWRDSGAITESVAEGSPLRIWRDMAQELYDLELDLKSPQTGRK